MDANIKLVLKIVYLMNELLHTYIYRTKKMTFVQAHVFKTVAISKLLYM